MKVKRLLAAAFAGIMLATSLSGCGGGNKKQFRFMTSIADEERTAVIDKVVDKLQDKYPDWKFVNDSGGEYSQKMKLAFSSGEGYDMVYVDDLNQQTLKDYLMDITKYVEEYGWADRQIEGAVEFNNQRTPGTYYSVPMLMAPVAVYYNKDLFEELNLEIPKTMDEFEQVMKAVKDAGKIPMEASKSNIVGWIYESIILNSCPKEDVDKWYYQQETTEAFKNASILASDYIQKWTKAGYFRDGFIGTDYAEIPQLFGAGETAMVVEGDWSIPQYDATGLNIGIFPFPVMKEGDTPCVVNATDGAWALNKELDEEKTKIGCDFIDIMTSEEIAKEWCALGLTTTSNADMSSVEVGPIRKEFTQAVANTSMGYFLDNVKPGFLDFMNREIELLCNNESTPEKMWEALDDEWNAK